MSLLGVKTRFISVAVTKSAQAGIQFDSPLPPLHAAILSPEIETNSTLADGNLLPAVPNHLLVAEVGGLRLDV